MLIKKLIKQVDEKKVDKMFQKRTGNSRGVALILYFGGSDPVSLDVLMSWHQAWDIKFTLPIRTFVQYMWQLQP